MSHKQRRKAIEKQKPKKVLFTPAYQSYFSAGDESKPYCPECGEYVEEFANYCSDCGQRLDWPYC